MTRAVQAGQWPADANDTRTVPVRTCSCGVQHTGTTHACPPRRTTRKGTR